MIHLAFLIASLGLIVVGQPLALALVSRLTSTLVRRCLLLLCLVLPLSVLTVFTLTMLPTVAAHTGDIHHRMDAAAHRDWLVSVGGLGVLVMPVFVSLGFNLGRVALLYFRTARHSWTAPGDMAGLLNSGKGSPEIRIWLDPAPFAFNLPGLWPLGKSWIVLSTGLLDTLSRDELQAVLWHEMAHLEQHDFETRWLALWWSSSFFYLPAGRSTLERFKQEQEIACDARVARTGGIALTVSLAEALLKIWEILISQVGSRERPDPFDLQIPNLAAPGELNLTEKRIRLLLEYGESGGVAAEHSTRLIAGVYLVTGFSLWLVILILVHLAMIPLGCTTSLNFV
ncbi:MAG TPA: M56 family metallopeptidase [Chloroflexia bacterium]|nr:M56 family metallopeptidase [Chloroflexia bacterium]